MILYATCPDDADGVTLARAWVKAHGIGPDDARLVRRDGCVLVIDKAETWRRVRVQDGDGGK
jgi:ribosomal protein L36